ncbi:uncharacterized protein [Ptychodera flava]|uniref:uncharacterized protein n=1 Tax=Ptychodera flava TaxID=63121 RepID=UPI00396A4DE3
MDMTSSAALVYSPRSLTSTLKNRVFTECKDLLEKFACKVFVIVSEDGLSSQYIGSQDFVRDFVTTGLKVKPCDVNVGLCPTATFESNGTHTIVEPSTDTYNRDNRNRDIFTKNEGVLLKQNSFTDITRETIDLQNDVNMADNYSQSGDSVMVEEDINVNRQQSNMDTQVAKWNDGIGDINGSNNDRKTCDPDTNQPIQKLDHVKKLCKTRWSWKGQSFGKVEKSGELSTK